MDVITLQTKEQLDIFMNPQRQKLLRIMELSAGARTPKDLSVELGVSPSSVQHHLKKLLSIGLVRLDHTASVHGIVASYYIVNRVTVRIGAQGNGALTTERTALLKMLVAEVVEGAVEDFVRPGPAGCRGDIAPGVVYLSEERKAELERLIRRFLEDNAMPFEGAEPWEYAIVYHCAQKKK